MAKLVKLIKVFVSSPDDVREEREILEEIVSEMNISLGGAHDFRVELVRWETHSRPAVAIDPQQAINEQLGDDYDVFLGIMWGRLGTPTARSGSGTMEEFERALARWKEAPGSLEIMFYFKEAGISPSKMDPIQIQKVQDFRRALGVEFGGLYDTFDTPDQFRNKARIHLTKVLLEIKKSGESLPQAAEAAPVAEMKFDSANPLANLANLADDDEAGIFELAERATVAAESITEIVIRISDATERLSAKFNERTAEIKKLAGSGSKIDAKTAVRISNRTAEDIESYVKALSGEIPEFQKQFGIVLEAFGKIAVLFEDASERDVEGAQTLRAQVQALSSQLPSAIEGVSEFRETFSSFPRLTSPLNRARRRGIAVLDDLITLFEEALNRSNDVQDLLD
jgi:hypothetical protein